MDLKQLIDAAAALRSGIEAVEKKTGNHHSALAHSVAVWRCLKDEAVELETEAKLKAATDAAAAPKGPSRTGPGAPGAS